MLHQTPTPLSSWPPQLRHANHPTRKGIHLAPANHRFFSFITLMSRLSSPSRAELRLWLHILSNWNGISFCYEEQLSHPEDINLFTDAAPSVGFGGFYNGKWFTAAWPPELSNKNPSSSTALFEIYPVITAAVYGVTRGLASRFSYNPTTWPS